LDAGANPDAKPNHLLQYAIMGSIYAKSVFGIESPRVGLLNVGTEEKKGSDLTKQTFPLLQDADINFIGNVEGRDLLEGVADIVVTDGFTGNIALKSIEGTALSVFSMLKETLTSSFKSKVAAGILKPQLKKLKTQMDYTEYGGAGLFGLKAPVIKAHGSSDDNAIFNAVKQAVLMVEQSVPKTIAEQIAAQNKKQEQTIESERKE
jgi:glycerol-3-phosphate acyltransferase PlsX